MCREAPALVLRHAGLCYFGEEERRRGSCEEDAAVTLPKLHEVAVFIPRPAFFLFKASSLHGAWPWRGMAMTGSSHEVFVAA